MKEREPLIVGGLVLLLLVLWLGFPLHQSPRFAGSFWGGVLGVSGAVLMLVPLAYLIVKRIKRLKRWVTTYVSMRTLLAWHIYAGVLGPILVLIHTGHKFDSALGITLTAMVLIVVVSGFVGRYLMSRINKEIKSKKSMLAQASARYENALEELRASPEQASLARRFRHVLARLFLDTADNGDAPLPAGIRTVRLAESVADLEYAVRTHEVFKRAFTKWLRLHIALSFVLYVLLGLHIWGAIYFGLRWFT
jgi:ABC-type multidrug transport system fused ATPase/permease subunit